MMEESFFPPADIASLFAGTNGRSNRKLWKKTVEKKPCVCLSAIREEVIYYVKKSGHAVWSVADRMQTHKGI